MLRDTAGQYIGVLALVTDVTAQRQAQEALRESEERYRAQYQGLPMPTFTWQRQGQDWVLIDFNKAAERVTAWPCPRCLVGSTAATLSAISPQCSTTWRAAGRPAAVVEHEMSYRFVATGDVRHLITSLCAPFRPICSCCTRSM